MARQEHTQGWHGTLVTFLEGIVASKNQVTPDEPNVVTFQADVKKLVESIRVARRDLKAARTKRAQLNDAWLELDSELIADEQKTTERLFQLQVQFARVATDECGLEVMLPPNEMF